MIGAVPALFAGGIAIIQPLSLYLIRPGPRRFSRMIGAYRIGASFYLAMAASALFLPVDAAAARIALFFTFYTAFVLIAGTGDPHYVAMVVASVSPKERGRFFGLRLAWFGVGGIIGGAIATPVLGILPSPRNFGLSLFVGGSLILLATLWFARFRDISHNGEGERVPLLTCAVDVFRLSRQRPSYLIFILTACLFILAQGPFAFIALFIKTKLDASDALLGYLNMTFNACGLVFALMIGQLGDRFGHRNAFLTGLALYGVGVGGTLLGDSAPVLFLSYFLAGTVSPTWAVSAFNLAYECAGEPDAARVYAGISLITAPIRVIGPLTAGRAVDRWDYPPVMAAALLLTVLTLMVALLIPCKRTSV
ncbi:MAG: MFS transporter [Armatimonadetes bacterium]|nr:MFS transporter [Armatimonadota bacterium]